MFSKPAYIGHIEYDHNVDVSVRFLTSRSSKAAKQSQKRQMNVQNTHLYASSFALKGVAKMLFSDSIAPTNKIPMHNIWWNSKQ